MMYAPFEASKNKLDFYSTYLVEGQRKVQQVPIISFLPLQYILPKGSFKKYVMVGRWVAMCQFCDIQL